MQRGAMMLSYYLLNADWARAHYSVCTGCKNVAEPRSANPFIPELVLAYCAAYTHTRARVFRFANVDELFIRNRPASELT